jgi:glycosyltransferase involved in cell wall biosynthesis
VSAALEVTAVIPAHNGLPDVLEAVDSALAQTLPPVEVVVVDDGSEDGTGDAVAHAFGPSGVRRAGRGTPVRVVRGRFGSAAAARNRGWREARTRWIALLDADDLWFAHKLETAAAALAAAPEAAWFFSDGEFRTLEGETRPSWLATYADLPDHYVGYPVRELIEVNFVLTSSVMARRDALDALGGFDERLSHAEDLDLWIRLARRWPAAASQQALVRYQHRAGGLTRQVEARLAGDITLFRRLGEDRALTADLRRAARRREALAHFKLGMAAMREGHAPEARAHFDRAWLFPERALPVAVAWTLSRLPRSAFAGLRRQGWATATAAPHARVRRVSLRHGGRPDAAADGGRR